MERSYDKYFRQNRLPHLWCPGCGNGIAMKAIVEAIEKKGLSQDNTVIVSGIGCSSRASGELRLIHPHIGGQVFVIVFYGTVYDCDHDSRVTATEIPGIGGAHVRPGPEIRAQTG